MNMALWKRRPVPAGRAAGPWASRRAMTALAVGLAGWATAASWAAPPVRADDCPNAAIRQQQGSEYLPECRAYERVSVLDTNRNNVATAGFRPDGEVAAFVVNGGADGSATGASAPYRAIRTATGWEPRPFAPSNADRLSGFPLIGAADEGFTRYVYFDDTGFFNDVLPTLARFAGAGAPVLLHRFQERSGRSVAASDDMRHVVVPMQDAIDPVHVPGTQNLYDVGDGTPELLSRLPDGTAPTCGAQFDYETTRHTLSRDAARMYFMATTCGNPEQLYLRQGGTTTLVSGPPVAGPDLGLRGFEQATADGSAVFYLSASRLVAADTNATTDVYRFTLAGGNTCLTCVVPEANVGGTGEDGALVSENGEFVYFLSPNQLVPGEGEPGVSNLFVLHDGELRYIAPADEIGPGFLRGSQVTPDGRTLLFRTAHSGVTADDNGGFQQYYRYAFGEPDPARRLTCVSCPRGTQPTVDVPAELAGVNGSARFAPGNGVPLISHDGSRVFFITRDALVSRDVNGDYDVYEWHDGAVGLITDGVTNHHPVAGAPFVFATDQLIGASDDGSTVFLLSAEPLTPDAADDPSVQLYAVRAGGGFAVPSGAREECTGDACQGWSAPEGPRAVAVTTTFRGPGDAPVTKRVRVTVARSATARGAVASLRVTVSGRGRLTVSGSGVRTVGRTATRPATYALRVALDARARRTLARRHRVRARVRVRFAAASGPARTTSVTVTFVAKRGAR